MKRVFRSDYIAVALALFVLPASCWVMWRIDIRRLKDPEIVFQETGLRLPASAQIKVTKSHLFSLADGKNHEWLIQSDISLLPWVAMNMSVERGGWEQIHYLSEISDLKEEILRNTKFGAVWKETRRSRSGQQETSYLFLSDDARIGVLSTFRP
jgi:hypothetical protein